MIKSEVQIIPLKIRSFGETITWIFRKNCSEFTPRIMLSFATGRYGKVIKTYIDWFMKQEKTPLFVSCMIETINRCNGHYEFCLANVNDGDRPFKKMTTVMFENIILRLKEMGQYGKLDEITINDYSKQYTLAKPYIEIYKHVKKNTDRFKNVKIVINRRYRKEILATRAGNAPNKPKKNNAIDTPCIYSFLDLLAFPDSKVGMCCNDCKEVTNFGDITQNSLYEIWNNEKFRTLCEEMRREYRSNYPFCKDCDVGEREIYIRWALKNILF